MRPVRERRLFCWSTSAIGALLEVHAYAAVDDSRLADRDDTLVRPATHSLRWQGHKPEAALAIH